MLLEDARKYGVKVLLNTVAWGLFSDRQVGVVSPDGADTLEPRKVVVATGAIENSLSFPGWTLPNVMGAGAAQTMVNVHRVLPGQRVLIVGSGNVGLIVAYQLLQAGAEVTAVLEALPGISGYQVHASKIVRMGVPILCRHTILRALGAECVQQAEIARVDERFQPVPGSESLLDVDLICIAVGLRPLAELCHMAGVRFEYHPALGGHVPLHDATMQTTLARGVRGRGRVRHRGGLLGHGGGAAGRHCGEPGPGQGGPAGGRQGPGRGRGGAFRRCGWGPIGTTGTTPRRRSCRAALRERGEGMAENPLLEQSSGVLTYEECGADPSYPSEERYRKGPIAVIECVEAIPCNPCQTVCNRTVITVGEPITNLPRLIDQEDLAPAAGSAW